MTPESVTFCYHVYLLWDLLLPSGKKRGSVFTSRTGDAVEGGVVRRTPRAPLSISSTADLLVRQLAGKKERKIVDAGHDFMVLFYFLLLRFLRG